MKQELATLWDRILAFDIDGDPNNQLPFAARLARENGWTRTFADRVILEYKRFVFLCLSAGRPMCPSEQVDQAWHLHLTYTRSYWQRFCKETLGQPLHHEPTRGGHAEADKHLLMYEDTFAAYREAFGTEPPPDIWSPTDKRFGEDLAERRINIRHYWVVPKAPLKNVAIAIVMLVCCVSMFAGCNGGLNPFEANGAAFIPYYLIALFTAFVVALIARKAYRQPDLAEGEALPKLDAFETAYLAGGIPRVLALALVTLKERGAAFFDSNGKVQVRDSLSGIIDPVETAVYVELAKQANSDFKMKPVGRGIIPLEATRFAKLEDYNLRVRRDRQVIGKLVPLLVMALPVIALGVPRMIMGLSNGKPTEYLIGCVIAGIIVSLIVFLRPLRRTLKGDAVVANLQRQHTADLRTLNNESHGADLALPLALFGTVALAGTSYAYMQSRMKPLDNSASGGCSTGSGCGGGGCGGGGDGGGGGGGCGGCGGGGGGD